MNTFLRWLAREVLSPDASDPLETAGFLILLVFVATAPLLAGFAPSATLTIGETEVGPAGDLAIELIAFLVGAVTFSSRSAGRGATIPGIPIAAMAALAGLGIVQLVPLPEKVLEQVARTNVHIYQQAAGILRLFDSRSPLLPRISIAPTTTSGSVLLILADIVLFVSAIRLLHNAPRRTLFRAILLVSSAIQVLVAVGIESARDLVHGAFLNSGHFAAYLEIAFALGFGSVWGEVLTGSDRQENRLGGAEQFERRFVPLVGRILLWGVIALGIVLTGSRAGLLAALATVLLLFALALARRRARLSRRARGLIWSLAGILVVGLTLGSAALSRTLGWDPPQVAISKRVDLWMSSLDAWRQFPIFGSGLGTFREAFRRVQPREISGLIEQGPADSLQLLVTGGAIGAALGIIVSLSLLVLLLRAWKGQKHRRERAFVLGGFGALLCLTLHGLADSNLSNPPIAATLACAIGAAWAAGNRKSGKIRREEANA